MTTRVKIFPRQGKMAPKATEREDGRSLTVVLPPPPSGCARLLPLAGEDWELSHTIRAIPIHGSR